MVCKFNDGLCNTEIIKIRIPDAHLHEHWVFVSGKIARSAFFTDLPFI